ncbi:MAG: hypothetical protein EBY80_13995, partial [Actinobacteria bacterium]|nr:hypothetical protein [Actinomycetota bacterium]
MTTRSTTSGTEDPDPDVVDSAAKGIVVTVTGDDGFTASGSGSSVPLVVLLVVTPLIAWPFVIRLLVRRRLRREGS